MDKVMSKYIFSTNCPESIVITPNLKIKYECISKGDEQKYIGRQKEFDFILASTEVKDMKMFLTNLQNNHIKILKNKQYIPAIITP